jgi:hypothetical protein
VTDGRVENIAVISELYPDWDVRLLSLDPPPAQPFAVADVVYCYGVLYHLSDPAAALDFISTSCTSLLLVETCVSYGKYIALNPVDEPQASPTQAITGRGCRPTRPWVWEQLRLRFEHVYAPTTQPWHEEFPLDWQAHQEGLVRAVFVAARTPIVSSLLTDELPSTHTRH